MSLSLTVAPSHPTIVVGHSNEVVATGPGIGVDQEFRHVQISGNKHETSRHCTRSAWCVCDEGRNK